MSFRRPPCYFFWGFVRSFVRSFVFPILSASHSSELHPLPFTSTLSPPPLPSFIQVRDGWRRWKGGGDGRRGYLHGRFRRSDDNTQIEHVKRGFAGTRMGCAFSACAARESFYHRPNLTRNRRSPAPSSGRHSLMGHRMRVREWSYYVHISRPPFPAPPSYRLQRCRMPHCLPRQPIFPGVYSRVSSQYEWIRETVCRHSREPPDYFGCNEMDIVPGSNATVSPNDDEIEFGGEPYVTLEVSLDEQPEEFSWAISTLSGPGGATMIATVPPGFYTGYSNYTYHHKLQVNPDQFYRISLRDSFGDGMGGYVAVYRGKAFLSHLIMMERNFYDDTSTDFKRLDHVIYAGENPPSFFTLSITVSLSSHMSLTISIFNCCDRGNTLSHLTVFPVIS